MHSTPHSPAGVVEFELWFPLMWKTNLMGLHAHIWEAMKNTQVSVVITLRLNINITYYLF